MLVSQESGLVNAWINRPRNRGRVKAARAPAPAPTQSQPKQKRLAYTVPAGSVVTPLAPTPTPMQLTPSFGDKHPSLDPVLQLSAPALEPALQHAPTACHWYFCLITALSILAACTLGSGWSNNHRNLVANHISIDKAITSLNNASTIFAEHCCPILLDSAKTARSSLNDAIVSGRSARAAVDAAVEAIDRISSQVMIERIEEQQILSCSQANLLADRLYGVAKQSFFAATQHGQTLNHTEKATGELSYAIKETNLARDRLYADRKSKHKSTWGQAQELLGISSVASCKKTLDEYNTQIATASILSQVREQTVLAINAWEAQQALWNAVAAHLRKAGDDLHITTNVPGRILESCVMSDQYRALMREVETLIRQIVVMLP